MIRHALAFALPRLGLLVLLIVLGLLTCRVHADVNESDVPPERWISQADTIRYAVVFTTIHPSDGARKVIRVFVKNISNTTQGIPWSSPDGGTGIVVYYLDATLNKHRIHDTYHAKPHFPGETIQEEVEERLKEEVSNSGSAAIRQIAPGATLSEVIVLSPADLALVKAQTVQCCFSIINTNTSKSFGVESKPAKLSELAVSPADN
jgi:hypothetical protein